VSAAAAAKSRQTETSDGTRRARSHCLGGNAGVHHGCGRTGKPARDVSSPGTSADLATAHGAAFRRSRDLRRQVSAKQPQPPSLATAADAYGLYW
jgi:hypothetical protein